MNVPQSRLAKSRLHKTDLQDGVSIENKIAPASASQKNNSKNYKTAVPSLVLGALFLAITIAIVFFVQPYSISNFPLQNMYFPFLAPLFLSIFFISSYLFLNSKRGFLVATAMTCIMWTHLVMPTYTIWFGLGLLVWFGILEWAWSQNQKV